jgi:hypothetical protein
MDFESQSIQVSTNRSESDYGGSRDDDFYNTAAFFRSAIDKDRLDNSLIRLFAIRQLPFSLLDDDSFLELIRAANPSAEAVLPTLSELEEMVLRSFESHKDTLRNALQSSLSPLHLAIDIWTRPTMFSLLAISVHFIDIEGEAVKVFLALRPLDGHSGEHQWAVLLPVLQEFGIDSRIAALTCKSFDNGALCRLVSEHLLAEKGIRWNPLQQYVQCQYDPLDQTMQAFFSAQDNPGNEELENFNCDNALAD